MKIGSYTLSSYNFGHFRLDGGSMFGSVPKNLWSKRIASDEENCIRLVTRSLILQDATRTILVDVGMGPKWSDKERAIYQIVPNPTPPPFLKDKVTDIILTHLHFDHAGGISHYDGAELKLTYPNATVHLQRANLENAKNPSVKERASYLKDNYQLLEKGKLNLISGDIELLPGTWVHQVNGHTLGQQWIEVRDEKCALLFPTDLIPTSHHLPLPFHMGYDACATTLLKEKEQFLQKALEPSAIVMFEHDPDVAAGKVALNERGQYHVKEVLTLD